MQNSVEAICTPEDEGDHYEHKVAEGAATGQVTEDCSKVSFHNQPSQSSLSSLGANSLWLQSALKPFQRGFKAI